MYEELIERLKDPCVSGDTINGFKMRENAANALTAVIQENAQLRAQQEQESNEPLTLNELRKMDGKPVWIVLLDGRIKSKWRIVGNDDWRLLGLDDDYKRYDKIWLAYRHKPEEGTT